MTVKWYRFTDNSKLCIDAIERGTRKATETITNDITNKASDNVAGSDTDLKRSISTTQNEGKQFKVLGSKSPQEYQDFSVNVPINEIKKEHSAYSKDFGAYAPWALHKEYGDPSEGVMPEPYMRPAVDEVTEKADKITADAIKLELDKHSALKK